MASFEGEQPWWRHAAVYQVYPRSFADSDRDGVGDLRGIIGRLDYLQWLGVDALWLSPIYRSPMADFGYDVSDYTAVDPLFGSMDDFDALVEAAHARDLRVIMDFVPNHTSDEHPWFIESRSSRDNPKRDWYIWRAGRPGGVPPNNWLGNFGGSAWTWDETTGEYYYHAFLPGQPDLNWRNEAVREAMADVLRFWMDRGVDGFRADVIWHLIKDSDFRDNPPNPDFQPGSPPHHEFAQLYNTDRPEVHEVIQGLRATVDEYPGRLLIGEIYLPPERLVAYYGTSGEGLHLPFNFQLVELPWDLVTVRNAVNTYETMLPAFAWPNWVLSNHDKPRVASRFGTAQARVAAMLLLTLRGTPILYYGDELGVEDVPIPPHLERDPYGLRVPGHSRDPQRTPMQWDTSPNAGFSAVSPWLPLAPDWEENNVEQQATQPSSMLSLYRALLALRRREPALTAGRYVPLDLHPDLFTYARVADDGSFVVALNFEDASHDLQLETAATVVLSTSMDRDSTGGEVSHLEVRPHEGLILRVNVAVRG